MNHITIKTLRFYEEQGLVFPAYVDEDNGYRYYKLNQMADLHRISALKQAGFSIEDMKRINKTDDMTTFLQKKRADIMMKIAELTRQMALIDSYLSGDEDMLETPVLIQDIPTVTVASMQKRIESYDELFTLMPTMGEEMERLGCECALPEYCFMQYLEPLFELPNEIRKAIYTSNPVESVNSALRKVTKGKGSFPNNQSVYKILFLRIRELKEKWNRPIKNWNIIRHQLIELFGDRYTKYLDI